MRIQTKWQVGLYNRNSLQCGEVQSSKSTQKNNQYKKISFSCLQSLGNHALPSLFLSWGLLLFFVPLKFYSITITTVIVSKLNPFWKTWMKGHVILHRIMITVSSPLNQYQAAENMNRSPISCHFKSWKFAHWIIFANLCAWNKVINKKFKKQPGKLMLTLINHRLYIFSIGETLKNKSYIKVTLALEIKFLFCLYEHFSLKIKWNKHCLLSPLTVFNHDHM